MERQPVYETLVLDEAEQARLPVIAQVIADELEPVGATRQDADLEAANARIGEHDFAASVDDDRRVPRRIGSRGWIDALQRRAAEIDRDTVAAYDDRRSGQVIGFGFDDHGMRDHHAGLELDGLRPLRKREQE